MSEKMKTDDSSVKSKKSNDFEYDVFLSFSSKDVDHAKSIWEEMRMHGLKVFLSDEDLKSNIGRSFFSKIESALGNSKNLVLICSPNSMKSGWVKTEYETFFNEYFIKNEQERRLIILKGNNFSYSLVPVFLKRLQIASSVKEIIDTLKSEGESETEIDVEGGKKNGKELGLGPELEERQEEKGELDFKEQVENDKTLASDYLENEMPQSENIIDDFLSEIESKAKKKRTFLFLGGLAIILITAFILTLVFNKPKLDNTIDNRIVEKEAASEPIKSGQNVERKPEEKEKQKSEQSPSVDEAILIASIQQPRLIKGPKPQYPADAIKARIQGAVVINVTTDIYGRVVRAKFINGHPLLEKAALAAVKSWVYEPYVLNGVPKAVKFTVVVRFALKDK